MSSQNQLPNETTRKLLDVCPVCSTHYESNSLVPLGKKNDSQAFHVTCQKCRHGVLAHVLENSHGISSIGLMTDLTAPDVKRIHTLTPISLNDILAIHTRCEQANWLPIEPKKTSVISATKRAIRAKKTSTKKLALK